MLTLHASSTSRGLRARACRSLALLAVACAPLWSLSACLLQDDQLYVSPLCAPFPDRAEVITPEDADCAAALDAYAQEISCDAEPDSDIADGGVDEEPPAGDAASPDAG